MLVLYVPFSLTVSGAWGKWGHYLLSVKPLPFKEIRQASEYEMATCDAVFRYDEIWG